MAESKRKMFIRRLGDDISNVVGNSDDLSSQIENDFYKVLHDNLDHFNSSNFDNDGFIKRMSGLSLPNDVGVNTVKDILSNLRHDNVGINELNSNETLIKRDIDNIVEQMPEMADVIDITRDAIIESDVVTGEIARSLKFENNETDDNQAEVRLIEKKYDLHRVTRNFIVPKTLRGGEYYINVISYKKIFSELEFISKTHYHKENVEVSFSEASTIKTSDNIKYIRESMSVDDIDSIKSACTENKKPYSEAALNSSISNMLNKISVYGEHNSVLAQELGFDGLKELMQVETANLDSPINPHKTFFEYIMSRDIEDEMDSYETNNYDNIKGSYIKYLDPLRMVPVRLDTKIVGYCYASTATDLQINQAQPNGIIDVSFQQYSKSQSVIRSLSDIIIKSFDKKMLESNMNLKADIADIIMAHRFEKGRLSFVYIPENEIVRFSVNEDENGKGHSVLERSMFPARTYILLTLYNLLYTLNNTTTRIHYIKSSGLNKNYAASVQNLMRKFQSRRITVDDIFSYTGVLNKVGGMGEMVLPAGKGDTKALETDTIPTTNNPIDLEYLDSKKKEAVSSSGVPALVATNAIDEVEFAKTMELANTRFLSLISSLKLQFNIDMTKFYKILLRNDTNMTNAEINSFTYMFNAVKQQALNITAQMVSDFTSISDLLINTLLRPEESKDADGNLTPLALRFREALLYEYLPQLDINRFNKMIDELKSDIVEDELKKKVNNQDLSTEEIDAVK